MNPVYANPMMYAPAAARTEAINFAQTVARVGMGLRISATMLVDLANQVVFLGFSYVAALAATTVVFHLNRVLRSGLQS